MSTRNPIRVRRAAAAVSSALVVTVMATGCTTSPGAAAVVGSQRISTETLQQAVDRALADPAAQQLSKDRAGFVRAELGRLINNMIISKAAAELGITASNADVDAELTTLNQQAQANGQQLVQAAAANGVPQRDLRLFVRFYVLQQKIAARLADRIPVSADQLQAEYQKDIDQFDQVHSAHILVKTQKQAQQILAQVRRSPGSFAALAKQFSIDTGSKDGGGDLGFQPHSAFVKPFADAIFAAKPASFIIVHTQFGWHVVHVIAHRTVSLEQATPQLKEAVTSAQQPALLTQELVAVSKKIGVHVNPRYGVWNAQKGEVDPAPAKTDLSSPAPSSAS